MLERGTGRWLSIGPQASTYLSTSEQGDCLLVAANNHCVPDAAESRPTVSVTFTGLHAGQERTFARARAVDKTHRR